MTMTASQLAAKHEKTVSAHACHINLTAPELLQQAISRGEGELSKQGSLVVNTGPRTGRSPQDRFIVCHPGEAQQAIDWSEVNRPMEPLYFDNLWLQAEDYLQQLPESYSGIWRSGQHTQHGLNIRITTELAWHQLLADHLLVRPEIEQSNWEMLCLPGFVCDPMRDHVHSDAATIIDFSGRRILLLGMHYAAEIKKAIFTVQNYLLPMKGVLPLHAAASQDKDGKVAMMLGLSATGKTCLISDDGRDLIGDDEHGWSDDGVFNLENGCYARCAFITEEEQPVIFDAIKQGAILENAVLDHHGEPDFTNIRITENIRATYPLSAIRNRVKPPVAGQPDVLIFLSCDCSGVLPPVTRLNKAQAAYYYLSGYTATVGDSEINHNNGYTPTFSSCFGAPFFPRPAGIYAEQLFNKLESSETTVYMVNTGWKGGVPSASHGGNPLGKRYCLQQTRTIITAILSGELEQQGFHSLDHIDLQVPVAIEGIDPLDLDPANAWPDKVSYLRAAENLCQEFKVNFSRFEVAHQIEDAGLNMI
ncbi:phosphoenolpyruvate carboxykinase (ATP) [Pelagibaculum spongiae]|uniref:Phosphoenolpyruvate carboxykinase (ATP) n=1 Tax=Pelagibaculum spongiae TaxID=2080658 RepID=A0A2V1GY10_9GAMM|nr:phosphoenolpyruvate carboxykinase (ATP) [Pelagibaculum spongiae]PVZ67615.1 phosphoenolpyruvate carboxykinase (ATP) [Pelagibaculum spongiae]